jgi:hypothetical protein
MIITLGILGILQVLFLPGLILQRFIESPKNSLIKISSLVASSLIVNYFIVVLLTTFGIFHQWICVTIIVLELTCLLVVYRKKLTKISIESFFIHSWNELCGSINEFFRPINDREENSWRKFFSLLFFVLFLIACFSAIDWIWGYFKFAVGRGFETWDAVVSWNRWAIDWSNNRFPQSTQDYPQLIPTAWAMIYQIIGTTTVQFFGKAIMPLFSLLIMLLMLGMGIKTRNYGYFAAIIIFRYLLKKFLLEFIIAGYVDLPLAFFTLLTIILLWYLEKASEEQKKWQWFLQAVFFAAGAAVTKQAGLYVLGITCLGGFLILQGKLNPKHWRHRWKKYLWLFLLVFVIVIPWYGYKLVDFSTTQETSHLLEPIDDTQESLDTQNPMNSLVAALKGLGNPLVFFAFLVPALLVIKEFWRLVTIFIIIPYTLIWAAYASYDTRNLALALPLTAIVAGLGIAGFLDLGVTLSSKLKIDKLPIIFLIVILIAGLFSLSLIYPNNQLIEQQIEFQRNIFSPMLNQQMIDYLETHELKGKILTNYPIGTILGLDNMTSASLFQNLAELQDIVSKRQVHYLLYPSSSNPSVIQWIEEQTAEGAMTVIFTTSDFIPYTFVEINQ